ncbi:MAG: hypothetical protein VR70_14465 [Rhodospirillaceae bacterium BRH_c57]|nr:MAG: hypothetical protein VR70_14465 [Rhodospirillaceae bacterium BRH_c57]
MSNEPSKAALDAATAAVVNAGYNPATAGEIARIAVSAYAASQQPAAQVPEDVAWLVEFWAEKAKPLGATEDARRIWPQDAANVVDTITALATENARLRDAINRVIAVADCDLDEHGVWTGQPHEAVAQIVKERDEARTALRDCRYRALTDAMNAVAHLVDPASDPKWPISPAAVAIKELIDAPDAPDVIVAQEADHG